MCDMVRVNACDSKVTITKRFNPIALRDKMYHLPLTLIVEKCRRAAFDNIDSYDLAAHTADVADVDVDIYYTHSIVGSCVWHWNDECSVTCFR